MIGGTRASFERLEAAFKTLAPNNQSAPQRAYQGSVRSDEFWVRQL
jgi:6-phosphogluconate dehydrogenase (decarboxylating)